MEKISFDQLQEELFLTEDFAFELFGVGGLDGFELGLADAQAF